MTVSKLIFWDGLLSVITPELYKKLIVAQIFFEGALADVRQNHDRTVTGQATEFHGLSTVLTVLNLFGVFYM